MQLSTPTHYEIEKVCSNRLYTILYSRPPNQIFHSKKKSDIKTQMTIQQLLLTSSKAISVLMLKDLCNSNTRTGKDWRRFEKKRNQSLFQNFQNRHCNLRT